MRWPGVLVALTLAVGIAGTAVALNSREGNPQFASQQQGLLPVGAAALDRLIATTSDPRPGSSGRARYVRCTSTASGALRNPWTCVVRYPRLPQVRYRVIVHADRSISGSGLPEGGSLRAELTAKALTVSGCCVGAP
ncbi:MAG: hypothetical protein ACHQC8_05645 [Solirubrobacterales bacterium]